MLNMSGVHNDFRSQFNIPDKKAEKRVARPDLQPIANTKKVNLTAGERFERPPVKASADSISNATVISRAHSSAATSSSTSAATSAASKQLQEQEKAQIEQAQVSSSLDAEAHAGAKEADHIFIKKLESDLKLICRNVRDDGDCLFETIALTSNQKDAVTMRQEISKYMLEHKMLLEEPLTAKIEGLYEEFLKLRIAGLHQLQRIIPPLLMDAFTQNNSMEPLSAQTKQQWIDLYIDGMKNSKTYGDEFEVYVAALMLDRPIVIHKNNLPAQKIPEDNKNEPLHIVLLNAQRHFMPLVKPGANLPSASAAADSSNAFKFYNMGPGDEDDEISDLSIFNRKPTEEMVERSHPLRYNPYAHPEDEEKDSGWKFFDRTPTAEIVHFNNISYLNPQAVVVNAPASSLWSDASLNVAATPYSAFSDNLPDDIDLTRKAPVSRTTFTPPPTQTNYEQVGFFEGLKNFGKLDNFERLGIVAEGVQKAAAAVNLYQQISPYVWPTSTQPNPSNPSSSKDNIPKEKEELEKLKEANKKDKEELEKLKAQTLQDKTQQQLTQQQLTQLEKVIKEKEQLIAKQEKVIRDKEKEKIEPAKIEPTKVEKPKPKTLNSRQKRGNARRNERISKYEGREAYHKSKKHTSPGHEKSNAYRDEKAEKYKEKIAVQRGKKH